MENINNILAELDNEKPNINNIQCNYIQYLNIVNFPNIDNNLSKEKINNQIEQHKEENIKNLIFFINELISKNLSDNKIISLITGFISSNIVNLDFLINLKKLTDNKDLQPIVKKLIININNIINNNKNNYKILKDSCFTISGIDYNYDDLMFNSDDLNYNCDITDIIISILLFNVNNIENIITKINDMLFFISLVTNLQLQKNNIISKNINYVLILF